MCGISGFFSSAAALPHAEAILQGMTDAIAYRGPDAQGHWCDLAHGIALGHRRLAVVDLTEAGAQPMHAASGRYVLVYNGEIYNHLALRARLEREGRAPAWRGHSDTETLLAGFDAWGVDATVAACEGMFAIALWDREQHTLTLGRDRAGEKPLYYGWQGRGGQRVFLFGSELKALRAHPAFDGSINRDAICLQMRHNYIPAPYSIYQGIAKLQPGTLLTLSLARPEGQARQFWSAIGQAVAGARAPFAGTPEQAVDTLEALLRDAVGGQMVADVQLGAFLSGGIDSSTVVALMQTQSTRPVKTFTIGFDEADYNEATHAAAVARHLGTEHTELIVTPAQAMEVIPALPALYDEPFSDSSQIPTYLVSRLARQHVTVALSGDAGDELFCGYTRYAMTARLWRSLERYPVGLRRAMAALLQALPVPLLDGCARLARPLLPPGLRFANPGDKVHKGAGVLASASSEALYLGLVSHWADPQALVLGAREPATPLTSALGELAGLDPVQRMMALDLITYLPDDILVKVDRAAMAVSLETRVPFLDHKVIEFAWRLPQAYKIREGKTKWALRQVLYRHVPQALIERPKMGFGVPVGEWLRGPLRDWAEALLDPARLRQQGYFNVALVRAKWDEHLAGTRNWQYHLWDVLMFQAWIETQ